MEPDANTMRRFIAERQQTELFYFVWMTFRILNPGEEFIPTWHVQAMVHQLERCMRGECTRLLITVPPRYLKSITVAVAFVSYWLGRDPTKKFMVASYGGDLASKHSRDCRRVMSSDFYRNLFPGTIIDPQRNTAEEFHTTDRGSRKAVSLGGPATGFGADVLIIDDLMKAQDASSAVERERARNYYDETLYSRLNDKQSGVVIAIQQRLHEDDFAAYLLEKNFEHLNLKAIAEEDEVHELPGGAIHCRRKGEALFPERDPLEALAKTRTEIGPVAFSAQYQQNPTIPGGNYVRWEWFQRDELPEPDEYIMVVQSWDCAYSEEPRADYSVCMTWALTKDYRWFVVDIWRKRVDFPKLRDACLTQIRKFRPDRILFETDTIARNLYTDLMQSGKVTSPILLIPPEANKVDRFCAQAGRIENKEVWLPLDAPWLKDFRSEVMAFPNGAHDDQCDCLALFLNHEKTLGRRATRSYIRKANGEKNWFRPEIIRRDLIRTDPIRR